MFDKNGCLRSDTYEGNIADIKDEMLDDGKWHRSVVTKEQDAWGNTITRKYVDGTLTEYEKTVPSHPTWMDPLGHV